MRACRPSRAATRARGKFVSWTTSGIHAGSRAGPDAARQANPASERRRVRLAASNSGKSTDAAVQISTAAEDVSLAGRSPRARRAPSRAPRRWPRESSARLRRTWTASTSARATTCSAVRRRSANPLPLSARAWRVMAKAGDYIARHIPTRRSIRSNRLGRCVARCGRLATLSQGSLHRKTRAESSLDSSRSAEAARDIGAICDQPSSHASFPRPGSTNSASSSALPSGRYRPR